MQQRILDPLGMRDTLVRAPHPGDPGLALGYGATAAWFGIVPAVVLGGLGTLGIVTLWAKIFPQLRQVDALETPQLY